MATLAQQIMLVDQQNKQNRQQLLSQVMPALNAMYNAKLQQEQAVVKYQQQREAELQKQANKMDFAEYQSGLRQKEAIGKANLDLQVAEKKQKMLSEKPMTPYEKENIRVREKQIGVQADREARLSEGGDTKAEKPVFSAKDVSNAKFNADKTRRELSTLQKSLNIRMNNKEAQGAYDVIVDGDKFTNKNGVWYNEKGKLASQRDRENKGLDKVQAKFETARDKYLQAQQEFEMKSGGVQTTQPTQPVQPVQQPAQSNTWSKYRVK